MQLYPSAKTASGIPATPSREFFQEVNALVRDQIGAIASLGGIVQGQGMIPKTRSGKTLRRVLRELVEKAAEGKYDAAVNVPPTVEDPDVVGVARRRVKEYFLQQAKSQRSSNNSNTTRSEGRAKL